MRNLARITLVILGSFCLQAAKPLKAPANPDALRTIVEPYGQIFPAFELASRALKHRSKLTSEPNSFGASDALIGASFVSQKANQELTLMISSPGLLEPSGLHVTLPKQQTRYSLYPTLRWQLPALRAVRHPRTVALKFELYAGVYATAANRIATRVENVTLRSSNDVLYGVKDPASKKILDFNWLFAAFVDEHSPAIAEVLRQAKASGVIDQFNGYQGSDEEEVYAQAFAIWHALQRRGIRYSNLPPITAPLRSSNISSQYVRFVSDTWTAQAANCVDGSVLIAAAFKRAGLAPVLVVLPGHMLVGVALDEASKKMVYLETTRLANVVRAPKKPLLEASLENFEAALAEGQRQVNAAGDRFEVGSDFSFQIIDIAAARRLGVMPISVN
jgi:hypothetical protein